jgi:poly(hydroxyalkanoate) depolymerase family esterase
MKRIRFSARCWLPLLSVLASTATARAASLQQGNGWGTAGLPADVTMYVYIPDKVVTNPPVLTLVHYCGGTAQAVFGQAQGGGIVKAADQYGFIMVVPSSGRCWDIVSNKTRTRDGGGDSHAIKPRVSYALQTYKANPDRVYSTGDSSGGMMTELLLALYPDMFKAGAAFAGMPAGCRGPNESGSGGGYSGACAGGNVSHTPQEWGDIVRMMSPGYTGHRPRVQLFHGDMDPTIKYPNHTEGIKEWSNVLGLMMSPSMTDMNVALGDHQATRQRWKNDCGYVTLDAFTSLGGDHGPSDALFKAEYVIPFLGLDKTGSVDPEIEQCKTGAGGSGGGGAGGSAGGGASGGFAGGGIGGAAPAAGVGGGGGGSGSLPSSGGGGAFGGVSSAGSAVVTPSAGSASAAAGSGGAQGPAADSSGCSYRVAAPVSGRVGSAWSALAVMLLAFRRRRAQSAP